MEACLFTAERLAHHVLRMPVEDADRLARAIHEVKRRTRSCSVCANVTEQDLLDFIDTHGEDVEFMRDLWTELETLLTERLEQNARDEENAATEEALEPDVNQDGDGGV